MYHARSQIVKASHSGRLTVLQTTMIVALPSKDFKCGIVFLLNWVCQIFHWTLLRTN